MAERTCRTCGKASEFEDGSGLCSLYDTVEYKTEISMILEEFEVWNLNITRDDGLPQKICLTCFDSFCQIHNFRSMCVEAQINFGEMCTGLDIIIKDEMDDDNMDFWDDYEGEQAVTVQEYYKFPGDEQRTKTEKSVQQDPIDSCDDPPDPESQDRDQELEACLELKQYRCEFCMGFVSFDDPEELNDHCNELHSTDLPYPCPKCDMRFDKYSKRNSHARCHYPTFLQCDKCGKKFKGDQLMMDQHIAYYHVYKDRQCTICHQVFEKVSLNRYFYHMNWHNESKLLKCKYCDKKFIQSTHLIVHEQRHNRETPFKCKLCGTGFANNNLLTSHNLLHEKNELIACPKCPKRYFSKMGLKLHEQKVHNPDKITHHCAICNITFHYAHNLNLHKYKKHNGPAPRTKTSTRTARPTTASNAALKMFKRQKKKEFIKPYTCDKCEDSFVLDIQLEKHMKIHDEHRPYPCSFCLKSFKREAHMKLHESTIHLNRKPYKCTICGAAFIQRSHLRDHINIKHEDIKNHVCDVCHKRFGTLQTLKIHKVIHSEDRPFECKICHKTYKQLAVLRAHMNCCHLWKKEGRLGGPAQVYNSSLCKEEVSP